MDATSTTATATPFPSTPRTYFDLLALARPWVPPPAPPPDSTAAADQEKKINTVTEAEICRALEIDVLGRLEDGSVKIFSMYHRRSSIVQRPSRMSYEDFIHHCGPPAKAHVLKSRVDDDVPGMWGVDICRAAIQMFASFRTLSNELELGAGCWQAVDERGHETNDVVIVGPDQAAVYRADTLSLERIDHPRSGSLLLDFTASGKHYYDFDGLTALLKKAESQDFRVSVYRDLLDLWSRWRWAHQQSAPAVLAGLVLATWVQQLWSWRPQVAIVGPSKSGKSMLCDALAGIFRNNVILTSDTTAAGLRQEIENSMPAVIVDEGDPKDRGQQAERRKILAMIRQSSRGGLTLRGSSNQRSVRHTLRHLFWIFGIQLPFDDEADRNRVILSELRLPERQDEGKLHLPSQDDLATLGQRCLAVGIWAIRLAKPLALRLRDFRLEGVDSRAIESYAVPAAILSVMFDYNDADTRKLLGELLAEARSGEPPTANHDALIHEILSSRLQVGTERLTVAQLLDRVSRPGTTGAYDAEQILAGCGVKLQSSQRGWELILQYQPIRKHLLRGSQWEGWAIDQILRVIPGSQSSRRRVGGIRQYSITIDWDWFQAKYLDEAVADRGTQEDSF